MTPRDAAALLLLAALWGGSFLFMRVASPELGPVLLTTLRVTIAGLALAAYAHACGEGATLWAEARARWKLFFGIAALNSAIPFSLIATATLTIPASLAATLNATTPLFGALVAWAWLGQGLTPGKVGGLLVGLAGVALLVGLGPIALTPAVLVAIACSLGAALLYGLAAVTIKVHGAAIPPLALATHSLLFAALLLLPAVPFALPAGLPPTHVWLHVLALAIGATAIATRLYFYLIAQLGPVRGPMVTYVTPAFGMLWAWLFLAETLTWGMFAGFALILASVGILNAPPRAARPRMPAPAGDP